MPRAKTHASPFPQGLVRMASAFIRGRPGEPLSGWAGGTGPLASVLYFDEVQVRQVRNSHTSTAITASVMQDPWCLLALLQPLALAITLYAPNSPPVHVNANP